MSKINRIMEICKDNDITIVSYRSSPNHNGFCYELPEHVVDNEIIAELNDLLDSLANLKEKSIKTICF